MTSPKKANIFALLLLLYSTAATFLISFLVVKSGINAEIAQLILIVIQDLLILLIPVIFYCIFTHTPLGMIIPHEKLSGTNILYVILLTFLISPIITVVSSVTTIFYPADVNTEILNYINKLSFPLSMLALAIMPAVFEELVFRGIILSNYKGTGLLKSAIVSGLFFGLFHQDFYQIGYALVAGVFFSFIVAYTNSIYASILSHFIINGTQVAYTKLLLSLMNSAQIQEILTQSEESTGNYGSIMIGVFFTAVFTPIFIITIKKFMLHNKNHKMDYELSISNQKSEEFEIDINNISKPKKSFIDIYFVLYVVISLALTLIYSVLTV